MAPRDIPARTSRAPGGGEGNQVPVVGQQHSVAGWTEVAAVAAVQAAAAALAEWQRSLGLALDRADRAA
jgi:hypothetical protein